MNHSTICVVHHELSWIYKVSKKAAEQCYTLGYMHTKVRQQLMFFVVAHSDFDYKLHNGQKKLILRPGLLGLRVAKEARRSMTTFYYYSVNHQSGLQRNWLGDRPLSQPF